MALPMFCETTPVRLAAALRRAATATPPASSEAFTILLPLESRLRLFCSIAFEAERLLEAIDAAVFVLMTTDMFLLPCLLQRPSLPRAAINGGSQSRWSPRTPSIHQREIRGIFPADIPGFYFQPIQEP